MSANLPRAALWYADYGWPVFPLRPHTKEPFSELGVYKATTDKTQVAQWWQRWPLANIGLHCGGAGLVAFDIDQYKDSYNGAGFLTPADEQTVTNLTGSGGTHLLFTLPSGAKYGNQTGSLPPGIDVRCWGGYIVVPPSIHPNGNRYQWEVGYAPHEIKPLPLPHTLRAILDDARIHYRQPGPPDARAVAISRELVLGAIDALEIDTYGEQTYGAGRKWIMRRCPFNPEENPHPDDRAAYLAIHPDGHISAGCMHARCADRLKTMKIGGWRYLLKQVHYE